MIKTICFSERLPLKELLVAWIIVSLNLGEPEYQCVVRPKFKLSGKRTRKSDSVFFANSEEAEGVLTKALSENVALRRLSSRVESERPPLSIVHGVDCLLGIFPKEFTKAIEWAFGCLHVRYLVQKECLAEAEKKQSRVEKIIKGSFNRKYKVVIIHTEKTNPLVLFNESDDLDGLFLIQWNEAGFVRIVTRIKTAGKILEDLIKIIRFEENLRSENFQRIDYKIMASPGILSAIPVWDFNQMSWVITNVNQPTKIGPGLLLYLLEIALREDKFDSRFVSECMRGFCTTTNENRCSLFKYGLSRCAVRRRQQLGREGEE